MNHGHAFLILFFNSRMKTSLHRTTKQFFTDNMGKRNTGMFVNGITDCSNFRAKVVRKEHLRKLWLGGGGGGGGGGGV